MPQKQPQKTAEQPAEPQHGLTAEQLRAELARIEALENAELARRAAVLQERKDAFDQHVLDTWKQIEDEISEEAKQHMAGASQAVLEGDLSTAFRLYSLWHASRAARYQLRTAAENAASRLGVVVNGTHMLREVNFSFTTFLDSEGDRAANHHGNTAFEQIYGEFPLTYEDVAATDPLAPAATGQEG